MHKLKLICGLLATTFVCLAGWRIAYCELANIELRDDLKDLSSQAGMRIGLASQNSDEQLRMSVINKARQYNIDLASDQVTVDRRGAGLQSTVYLQADYVVPVHLPGFDFTLHFTPESGNRF